MAREGGEGAGYHSGEVEGGGGARLELGRQGRKLESRVGGRGQDGKREQSSPLSTHEIRLTSIQASGEHHNRYKSSRRDSIITRRLEERYHRHSVPLVCIEREREKLGVKEECWRGGAEKRRDSQTTVLPKLCPEGGESATREGEEERRDCRRPTWYVKLNHWRRRATLPSQQRSSNLSLALCFEGNLQNAA